MIDTIETAEVVETTAEIVPYESPATALTMYGTSDPVVARQRIVTIAGVFVDLNRRPVTPALPGSSACRSKLSPAKSPGTTGPGCPASTVIVTS